MVEIGKDLLRSSSQNPPCLKQGLPRLPRIMFAQTLNMSIDGDFTTPLGSLCHCLFNYIIQLKKKEKWNFLFFSVCPLPLVLSASTTGKSLIHYSFPFTGYLCTLVTSSWAFSPLGWTVPVLSNFLQKRCSSPSVILGALCWTLSSKAISLL